MVISQRVRHPVGHRPGQRRLGGVVSGGAEASAAVSCRGRRFSCGVSVAVVSVAGVVAEAGSGGRTVGWDRNGV